MNKKRVILVAIAIVIILIIILLTVKLINIRKNNEKIENADENNIVIENQINENIINEEIIDDNIIENEEISTDFDEENKSQEIVESTPVADPEQEVDKQTIEKQKSGEEKAMDIAKKDWGTDSTVYFSYEGMVDGKHKVCVRENSTTHALRYYIINVDTGDFTIEY